MSFILHDFTYSNATEEEVVNSPNLERIANILLRYAIISNRWYVLCKGYESTWFENEEWLSSWVRLSATTWCQRQTARMKLGIRLSAEYRFIYLCANPSPFKIARANILERLSSHLPQNEMWWAENCGMERHMMLPSGDVPWLYAGYKFMPKSGHLGWVFSITDWKHLEKFD